MIADRTYHRLLHVDWIRADVNGDGIPEYVPRDDQAGPAAPQRTYSLFSTRTALSGGALIATDTPGFYLGGTIYSDWTSVPDVYKTVNKNQPDSRRSTGSIFKFAW